MSFSFRLLLFSLYLMAKTRAAGVSGVLTHSPLRKRVQKCGDGLPPGAFSRVLPRRRPYGIGDSIT